MTREDEARELLAVAQADREAAVELSRAIEYGSPVERWSIDTGQADDHVIVQAFAKHRLASTRPSSPASVEVEELRKLSERATDGPWTYEEDHEGWSMGWIVGGPKPRPDNAYPLPGDTLFDVCGGSGLQAINAEFTVAAVNYVRQALTVPARPVAGEVERLREAAQGVLGRMFSTYKARNGREVGIQGDDGEKCWIVHSDDIIALEAALASLPTARADIGEATGQHKWEPSPYGHGDQRCAYCLATNREIAIVGDLNSCDKAPTARAGIGEERLKEALERQMEAMSDEDAALPSSVHREAGRVWLEGWFDLSAALASLKDHAK